MYQWQHVPDTALSQIAKSLRDQSVDLGMVAEASHKGQIPSKTSGPVRFFRPLIQCVVDKIKTRTDPQACNHRSPTSKSTTEGTPNTPALPTESTEQASGSQPTEPQAETPEDDTQPDKPKPRPNATNRTTQTRWTWP